MKDCKHENTETRKMSGCNQIRLQCLHCGMSVGPAIPHRCIAPWVLDEITEFDYEFRDLMQERISELWRLEAEAKRAEWESGADQRKADYTEYLLSREWRQKRQLVIERENNTCQGCRQRRIEEIHHLTYENRGDELLYQLAGLCSDCHRKAHKINLKQ